MIYKTVYKTSDARSWAAALLTKASSLNHASAYDLLEGDAFSQLKWAC